ncbi:MAG: CotH kinase family protein, partial [Bacteroidales bacterium]|nr:CotH kinase family protein [Bacteroidales bacterium]
MKHLSCGARRLLSVFLFLFAMASIQAQLVFSEVMAVNTDGEYNPVIGEPGDWIEIYNGTPYAVDLSGYYLSDDPDDPFKWKFPQKTYLNNGYYHLIWADGTNDTLHGSHTNFKLGSAGESLFLHNLQGELYDSLSYPMMFENVSFGISDDGSRVYFGVPTPGSRNDSSSGYLVTGGVEFEPPPALYPSALSVSLIPEIAGSTIRYTLDGSPPEPSDPVYTAPIPVTENTVIRARLWTEGYEPGRIATSTYILSEGFTLPVISLVTDPAHLFDDQTGIYVEGTNGIPGYCEEEPKNWNQDWERPMSMEYFDLNGSRQVQHDGGTKIHGGCSRQAPLKSLAFFARSKYGKNRIEYPFFSQKEADSFKGLIFRNSGNDYWYSFMRDAVMQAVVTPSMDLDDQAYEPVQLFLNGEYWGIHNLREKVNEHWVTSNYGIPDENLDFIKNRNEVFAGSYHAYSSLSYFLFNNSMAIEENYQQVANQVDIGSYMDYLITQMFFINRDWPGNNQKCWRDRVNGSKWRWILFDLDFGFGLYDFDPAFDMFSFSTTDTVDEWPNPAWSTLMIRKLLENDGYREEFIGKYMMHLNTTFNPDHVNHVIDSFYYRLVDIFPAHLDRWNRDAEGDWEFRTMEEWEYNVEELRLFARARPAYVWQNMRDFFSLGEQILLNVESSHGLGQILVNGVIMPQNGMNGHYAAGSDINLEFHAEPGYQLNHWEVTGLV